MTNIMLLFLFLLILHFNLLLHGKYFIVDTEEKNNGVSDKSSDTDGNSFSSNRMLKQLKKNTIPKVEKKSFERKNTSYLKDDELALEKMENRGLLNSLCTVYVLPNSELCNILVRRQ